MRRTLGLALFALAAIACGAGRAPIAGGHASVRDAGGAADAADDAPPPLPALAALCPDDAAWTGSVCMGRGYVTCPGGFHLDASGRCTREAADAGAPRTPRDAEP